MHVFFSTCVLFFICACACICVWVGVGCVCEWVACLCTARRGAGEGTELETTLVTAAVYLGLVQPPSPAQAPSTPEGRFC